MMTMILDRPSSRSDSLPPNMGSRQGTNSNGGGKPKHSDTLLCDSQGILYYGKLLTYRWRSSWRQR
jgi:hypothetical protein